MTARLRRLTTTYLAVLLLTSTFARATVISASNLFGTWDCQSAAMNERGHPGAGITFKPRSLLFTFGSGNTWNMEGNGAAQTKKSGTFTLSKTRLILKNLDGSTYQDWQVFLNDDMTVLQVSDKKTFESFKRLPQNSSS